MRLNASLRPQQTVVDMLPEEWRTLSIEVAIRCEMAASPTRQLQQREWQKLLGSYGKT